MGEEVRGKARPIVGDDESRCRLVAAHRNGDFGVRVTSGVGDQIRDDLVDRSLLTADGHALPVDVEADPIVTR